MSRVTIRQRVLLHLLRFSFDGDENRLSVPFDVTQDGIATVVGITRAHVSLVLRKELEKGNIRTWSAHTAGNHSKRLAYSLTLMGRQEASNLKKQLESDGIDHDSILNIDRCDPANWWRTLSEEDRDTFGKACVLRKPISRSELPETKKINLPMDRDGMVILPKPVGLSFISFASEERRRSWHSWAAEHIKSKGQSEYQEIIYHLSNSGRMREACRWAVIHSEEILLSPSERAYRDISKLVPDATCMNGVLSLQAELAIETGRTTEAKHYASTLMEFDVGRGTTLLARAELRESHLESATKNLVSVKGMDSTPDYLITCAESMFAHGNLEKASEYLDAARDRLYRSGDKHDMDRLLAMRALISHAYGDDPTAIMYIMDASKASSEYRRKMMISSAMSLCELYGQTTGKNLISTPCSF